MSRTAMPIGGDMLGFLKGAGLVASSPTAAQSELDLDGAAAQAVSDWERDTRFEPFLSDGTDVTLKFSPMEILQPPNELPFLDVDGGVISISLFLLGVTATNPGVALVQDHDFYLRPGRAASKGKPYTYIEFYRSGFPGVYGLGGDPDSIRITCKRGYGLTVPDLAFGAVLARAAEILAPQIAAAISGGLLSWKEADATAEQYGQDPLGGVADRWHTQYRDRVKKFSRLT